MIIDLFLFPTYVYLVLIIGLSFFRCLGIFFKSPPLISNPGIVLLAGQFAIGAVSLTANFFVGLAQPYIYIAYLFLFIFGLTCLGRYSTQDHCVCICFAVALVPLAAFMPAGYDTGLYHLPHQVWIREEKIVFGLANFHGRFGFGSFQEYISAPQWIGAHFKLLAYSMATYVLSFLIFLWKWSASRNDHRIILAFFTATTIILIFVMRIHISVFHWSYGNTDIPAGFLFAMAFLTGASLLHAASRQDAVLDVDIFVFSFLSLFAVLMKLSTILVLAWAAAVYVILVLTRAVSLPRAVVLNLLPLTVLITFLIKNVVVSGCLFYPVAKSCLMVAWSAKANAQNDADWITAWARHPRSGLYSLHDSSWLKNYWLPEYGVFCIKMLAIVVLLVACSLIINRLRKVSFSLCWSNILGLSFLFFGLLFWFFSAPMPRFGLGVFLALPPFLAYVFLGDAAVPRQRVYKFGTMAKAGVLVLGFLLGGWNTQNFSIDRLTRFEPLSVGTPVVVQDAAFGVRPKVSDQCWIVPYCAPYSRSTPEIKHGYLFFPSIKDQE
jgi:hypothetical protein